MRRGADYLASLRDGRAVFLDGKRVDDVTTHPAFAESVRRIAERYDAARGATDVTTCTDPATGRTIGAMWLIPRSAEDLGRRRAVHRFWAEGSYGLMGRTPITWRRCSPASRDDASSSIAAGASSETTWCASTPGRATKISTWPTRSCRPR